MEKSKRPKAKSIAFYIMDIIIPGYYSLNQPIEGISNKLRYETRLWRIRLGLLGHSLLALDGVINHNYIFTATNLSFFAVLMLYVGGRPFNWRRLKRICYPHS